MRKFLLLLMILIGSNCVGQSKVTNLDTLCPTVTQLKKVYAAAEQKKVLEEVVQQQAERIENLLGLYKDIKEKDSVSNVKHTEIVAEKDVQLGIKDKIIRKEKRKRFWTSVGGTAATVGAFWLGMQLGK